MNRRECKNNKNHGPSSYHMQDPDKIFNQIDLKGGEKFLDLGCGAGDYSIAVSKIIGENGLVYALDVNNNIIQKFQNRLEINGINNVKLKYANITEILPIKDKSIDICFICTVLHSIYPKRKIRNIFREVERILNKNGKLIVIECKKENSLFGPPLESRISLKDLDEFTNGIKLRPYSYTDLGFNYMREYRV